MSKFRTYDYLCTNCSHREPILLDLGDEEDVDLATGTPHSPRQCTRCSSNTAELVPSYLTMPNTTKASYVDGTRRKGWSEMREASKLNIEAAGARTESKKEIEREIKRMGVDIRK